MNEELVMKIAVETLKTTALVSAPLLVSALVTGLIVSFIQAITQINEATLTFIPKMIVIAIVIVVAGPWMMDLMQHFTIELFENIVTYVRN